MALGKATLKIRTQTGKQAGRQAGRHAAESCGRVRVTRLDRRAMEVAKKRWQNAAEAAASDLTLALDEVRDGRSQSMKGDGG